MNYKELAKNESNLIDENTFMRSKIEETNPQKGPRLILISGTALTGKSTIADWLDQYINYDKP